MFSANIYKERRNQLKKTLKSGIYLFLGNEEVPMNYPANTYPFRQDSTFLYYWGIDLPGFAAIMDVDEGREIIFADDFEVDDVIWMGPQPSVQSLAEKVGVKETASTANLYTFLKERLPSDRKIHYLPPYRSEIVLKLRNLLGISPDFVQAHASLPFIKAVIAQRSIKSAEEIAEIEKALDITYEIHLHAMRAVKPGMYEYEIAGELQGIALKHNGRLSFPLIFSVHGETLHNVSQLNRMEEGRLVVNDCGGESSERYAGDITRTFPVSKTFTERQKAIYEIVLKAQMTAIGSIRPGIRYRDIHLQAAHVITDGLKDLGLMKGSAVDAVTQGAHALFFPHGLGHMMGLDVHDMENLGEDYVGYDESIKRSNQFGLAYLRLGKALKPGFVLTVEPGIYFIPKLIELWKKEGRFYDFINYSKVEEFLDFGGIRIEDDVLVTEDGHRVLGKPIPKQIEEVEALRGA